MTAHEDAQTAQAKPASAGGGPAVRDTAQRNGKVALVLEGGSLRAEFTAGVLDVLMEQGVTFDACYGVSAGTLCGLNFKSHQIGRVNRVNLAFCNDSRYMGSRAVASSGSLVGYDFILYDVQDRIDPFDTATFLANPMPLYATVTDLVFGTAEYLDVKDPILDIDAVRASTSIPLLAQAVEIGGRFYLDGGIADSVPVERALEHDGYDRAVVVLTQHRGYRKEPYEFMRAARGRYGDYPYFLEALESRHERYNEQREHIWSYEDQGRALVIVPPEPVEVTHMEHDTEKLLRLYIQGRQEAARMLDQIRAFAA